MAALLLGEWGFLDNLDDTSGNARHGTLSSGSPAYVAGPQANTRGLKFSSEGDSVSFGRTGLEPSLEGITVMGWVRFEGTPAVSGTPLLFALSKARATTSSRSRMGFGYTTATNQRQRAGVARWKDALLVSDGGPTWTDSGWHHLAIVDGNTRYGFYLDGVQDTGASRALGAAANTTWENFPWRTGFNTDLNTDMGAHPNMSVSGIRIFQGELTTTEIQTWRDTPIVAAAGGTPVSASFTGTGSLTATAIRSVPAPVALAGNGALTATVQQIYPIPVNLLGGGTLSAAVFARYLSALGASGAGLLTALLLASYSTSGAVGGGGTMAALISPHYSLSSDLDSSGVLTATMVKESTAPLEIVGIYVGDLPAKIYLGDLLLWP